LLTSTLQRWCAATTLLLGLALLIPARSAAEAAPAVPLGAARDAEAARNWFEACQQYDAVLRQDRGNVEAREGYARCLRRLHLVNRHRDPAYRESVANLSYLNALDVYEQVLQKLSEYYVDRPKTDLTFLFQQGVAEFRFALEEDFFQNDYLLPEVPREAVGAFRPKLDSLAYVKVKTLSDARQELLGVIRAAQAAGLIPRATREFFISLMVMEFACGACNGLDEYTLFLTPRQMRPPTPPRGKAAGIGVEVALVDQKVKVSRVYPRGPARELIFRHEQIVSINGEPVGTNAAEVADRLRGEPGSFVELVVASGDDVKRTVKIARRLVQVPTVDYELLFQSEDPVPIGRIRIYQFQETTVQEVREALAQLQTDGIRALILDLRGNPGGLFKASVQVAGLFLGEAVIAVTQSPVKSKDPDKNFSDREWKTEDQNPFVLPMVVLIDGETASSAEVLAGALKEHKRAELIGQTTFGKGSVQSVVTLDAKAPGGIRITFARFYSPSNRPFGGRGVEPDHVVKGPMTGERDLIEQARRLLRARLGWEPMPPGMMPPAPVMPPSPMMPGAAESL
jgi:carboxyl-terminal processing protease